MNKAFPVKGLAQLDHYLSALPANLQKNAIRQGLTAVAAVIRDEARALAPKETGGLAKAIGGNSACQNPHGTWLPIKGKADKRPITQKTSLSERGVQKSLRTLERDGHISRQERRGHGVNLYHTPSHHAHWCTSKAVGSNGFSSAHTASVKSLAKASRLQG